MSTVFAPLTTHQMADFVSKNSFYVSDTCFSMAGSLWAAYGMTYFAAAATVLATNGRVVKPYLWVNKPQVAMRSFKYSVALLATGVSSVLASAVADQMLSRTYFQKKG